VKLVDVAQEKVKLPEDISGNIKLYKIISYICSIINLIFNTMTKQINKVTKVAEDVIPVEVNQELENEVVEETSSTEYESTEESIEKLDEEVEAFPEEIMPEGIGEITDEDVKSEPKEELPVVSEPKGEDFTGILINSTPQYSIYFMK
jgi:hypothetical protein